MILDQLNYSYVHLYYIGINFFLLLLNYSVKLILEVKLTTVKSNLLHLTEEKWYKILLALSVINILVYHYGTRAACGSIYFN